MNSIEIVAFVFSVAGVYLTAKQRIIAWPIGAVAVAFYVWIFFGAKLYADALLNAIYVVLQLYGWWLWSQNKAHGVNTVPVTRIKSGPAAVWLAGAGISSLLIAYLLQTYTDQDYAYVDSAILTFSLVAQYWMARKNLACWTLWIVIDAVAAGLYWVKSLPVTAGLYIIFLALAVVGYRDWKRQLQSD